MARALVLLLLATGCGRIGFDAIEGGIDASGIDAARDAAPTDAAPSDAEAPTDARSDGSAPDGGPPGGPLLITADYEDGEITVYFVGAGGELTPTGQGPVPSRSRASYMALTSDNRFLYVPHENDASEVSAFAVDTITGYLGPVLGSPFVGSGSLNQMVLIHPSQRFLYVSGSAGIQCYSIEFGTGVISPRGTPAVVPGAFMMAMDPRGELLYSSVYLSGELQALRIDGETCALTRLGGLVFSGGDGIHGLTFDPSGEHLVFTATGSDTLRVLEVDRTTGAVMPVGTPAPRAGGRWATFDTTGRFVLSSGAFTGVHSHAFDSATGALRTAPGRPVGEILYWNVAATTTGFVYASSDTLRIDGFTQDTATGELLPLAGFPIDGLAGSLAMVVVF